MHDTRRGEDTALDGAGRRVVAVLGVLDQFAPSYFDVLLDRDFVRLQDRLREEMSRIADEERHGGGQPEPIENTGTEVVTT
jgi:hypothetical protein